MTRRERAARRERHRPGPRLGLTEGGWALDADQVAVWDERARRAPGTITLDVLEDRYVLERPSPAGIRATHAAVRAHLAEPVALGRAAGVPVAPRAAAGAGR